MKKIVVSILRERDIWVFGIFNTFKSAYENVTKFYPEIFKHSGYKDNVRGFTKAIRDGHTFEYSETIHRTNDDGTHAYTERIEHTFYITEQNMSEVHPYTYRGIDTFEKMKTEKMPRYISN